MAWAWQTVSLTEIVWVLLCLAGIIERWRIYGAIQRDLSAIDAGRVSASPGARALFANDAATELDWIVMKALLAGAGIASMFRANAGYDWQGWLTIAFLFAAIAWVRWRSFKRGNRRADVKARNRQATERKGPAT